MSEFDHISTDHLKSFFDMYCNKAHDELRLRDTGEEILSETPFWWFKRKAAIRSAIQEHVGLARRYADISYDMLDEIERRNGEV